MSYPTTEQLCKAVRIALGHYSDVHQAPDGNFYYKTLWISYLNSPEDTMIDEVEAMFTYDEVYRIWADQQPSSIDWESDELPF